MRKLLPTVLAGLLALCAVAGPARALSLPLPAVPLAAPAEEDEAEASDEFGPAEDEAEEEELDCVVEDEEDAQFCAEIAAEEREEEAEECLLRSATAKVSAKPGTGSVGLTIRYKAYSPASVAIDARLRGGRGGVHLGASHARFRRAGIFRDTFALGEKRMERALAAREFEVELQALNTPRNCRIELSGALPRAKRPLRADARDRSGGPGRIPGR